MRRTVNERCRGVDSSTQSCKVLAVDAATGDVLSSGAAAHPDLTAVDPRMWTSALKEARQAAGAVRLGGAVIGVSIAAQQHGMVALDNTRTPVHDALLWNDTGSDAAPVGTPTKSHCVLTVSGSSTSG